MEAMDSNLRTEMKIQTKRIPSLKGNTSMKKKMTRKLTTTTIRTMSQSATGMASPIWQIREEGQEIRHMAARQRWMLAVFTMKQETRTKKKTRTQTVKVKASIHLEATQDNQMIELKTINHQIHLDGLQESTITKLNSISKMIRKATLKTDPEERKTDALSVTTPMKKLNSQ